MTEDRKGICPHCERRQGPVGELCQSEDCRYKGYRFIPVPWYESARDFAHRKGRTLDPLLGRMLERYLLAGKLGEGGMGAVYLAFQQPLNREVALKIISGLELTASTRSRFEREARAISVLDHPNIVKLYDYGIGRLEFELPYMALEYVKHGRTLRRALADLRKEYGEKIPGEVILVIFEQVLNALGAAHELGLVHRDMKPDNVMITRVHGNPLFVKLLDFGLVKAVQEMSGFESEFTHTDQLLGTPVYMAPEQVSKRGGPKVDARTDLYAVAVMLFEVFTGIRPFEGETPLEVINRKTQKEYWPLDLPAARVLTRPMQDFLSRGLQPRQEDRFQSAEEMLEAFRQALAGRTMTAVGLDWNKVKSSEDRPQTPQSPRADEDLGRLPTMPMEDVWIRGGKPAEGASMPMSDRRSWLRAWPWFTAPVIAAIIAAGVYIGLGSGNESSLENIAPVETISTPVAMPREPAAQDNPAPVETVAPKPEIPQQPAARRLSFEVRSRPEGAQARVDGRLIGVTPTRYEFEIYNDRDLDRIVEVALILPGYHEVRKTVRLGDAINRGLDIALVREQRPKAPPPAKRGRKLL